MHDAHKILGLTSSATDEDIKDAYRTLSKIFHPDIPETGDAERFKKIKDAFDYLSNVPDYTTKAKERVIGIFLDLLNKACNSKIHMEFDFMEAMKIIINDYSDGNAKAYSDVITKEIEIRRFKKRIKDDEGGIFIQAIEAQIDGLIQIKLRLEADQHIYLEMLKIVSKVNFTDSVALSQKRVAISTDAQVPPDYYRPL